MAGNVSAPTTSADGINDAMGRLAAGPLEALEGARDAFERNLAAQLATFLDGSSEARFQLQDGSYLVDQVRSPAAAASAAAPAE